MLVADSCPRVSPPTPKSFSGLMEMYETNYIRFRRLCPGLNDIAEHAVSEVDAALDLHLRICERSTYTTTCLLTYYLQGDGRGFTPNPNLKIRVYHDARQVEVMGRDRSHHGVAWDWYRRGKEAELVRRWRLNRFLYKWLGYCRFQGHGFETINPL